MKTSALNIVQKIKECDATHSLWEIIKHDLALTREEFATLIGYHRNSVGKWEQKIMPIPALHKQYWNGNPRSKYLTRYQMVVLLVLMQIKKEHRGHEVISRLRILTPLLEKQSIIESIEVLKHV